VLVEHPLRSDWELVEPKEAAERTREFYRFRVTVDRGEAEKLTVREQKQLGESLELVSTGSDVIAYYLRAKEVSAKAKQALEKVVSLRDALSKTIAEKTRREQRVNEIAQEQNRIRENLAKLNQSSDLYTRYVKKLDEQETELENLRKEIERLKDEEIRQQRALDDYLLNLEVDG
jgi:myosin heavy subunit